MPRTPPARSTTNGKPKPLTPYQQARVRREHARARLAELDVAQKEGELIKAQEAEDFWSGMIVACRARLLGLPTRLAAVCEQQLRAVIFARATDLVHEALTELSQANPAALIRRSRAKRTPTRRKPRSS